MNLKTREDRAVYIEDHALATKGSLGIEDSLAAFTSTTEVIYIYIKF